MLYYILLLLRPVVAQGHKRVNVTGVEANAALSCPTQHAVSPKVGEKRGTGAS